MISYTMDWSTTEKKPFVFTRKQSPAAHLRRSVWSGVGDLQLCTFGLAVSTVPNGSEIACGPTSKQQKRVDHLASRNDTTKVNLFGHYHL